MDELNKAALAEAKAYLGQLSDYLCFDVKVGFEVSAGVTLAEAEFGIEGCYEEKYSLDVGAQAGAEVTIIDKGWCEAFQKGFKCASTTILNYYLSHAE